MPQYAQNQSNRKDNCFPSCMRSIPRNSSHTVKGSSSIPCGDGIMAPASMVKNGDGRHTRLFLEMKMKIWGQVDTPYLLCTYRQCPAVFGYRGTPQSHNWGRDTTHALPLAHRNRRTGVPPRLHGSVRGWVEQRYTHPMFEEACKRWSMVRRGNTKKYGQQWTVLDSHDRGYSNR